MKTLKQTGKLPLAFKKYIYNDLIILELENSVVQAKERELLQMVTIYYGLKETITFSKNGLQWLPIANTKIPY